MEKAKGKRTNTKKKDDSEDGEMVEVLTRIAVALEKIAASKGA
jgi:hypothetical protein